MNINKYLTIIRSRLLIMVGLLGLAIGFAACQQDSTYDSYANMGVSDDELKINAPLQGLEPQWFNLYSDYSSWYVEVEYLFDEELDWIFVWPNKGSEDGRFSIKVNENENTPYLREANVHVKSGDKTLKTIRVSQAAFTPTLELGMEGLTRLTFSSKASEKTARLNTNVLWMAEVLTAGADWLSIGESTSNTLNLSVVQNTGNSARSAVVRFSMLGGDGDLTVDLNVMQRDSSTDAEFASEISIAEILNQVGPAGGEISDNVYIEGYVTSDLATRNFDNKRRWPGTSDNQEFDHTVDFEDRFMWVQDTSEKGMMFEWLSGVYNIYPLNTKVKIHLFGATVVVDSFTGSLKIGSVEPDMIFHSEASEGIAPVELDSFDNIADYVNTLVKVNPVQFALPYGTYVNIDPKGWNANYTTSTIINSVPYSETSRQFSHYLMDKNGNRHRLVTEVTFTERYNRLIPSGSGPITAIVTKNWLAHQQQIVLRLRHDSDNEVSDDASTRLTKVVTRFGPFLYDESGRSSVSANIGDGTLKTSIFTKVTPTGNSTGIYWASTYARTNTSGITIDENGAQSVDEEETSYTNHGVYACLNANNLWNSSMASSILDQRVEGWIITLSTKNVTGDLYLTFDSSSSQSGPSWMRLQWKEIIDPNDEFATKDKWNNIITRYELPNWDANYHCQQYSWKLPDELKGKDRIIIRHITDYEDDGKDHLRCARNGTTSGSGGTNRIGVWSLEEFK